MIYSSMIWDILAFAMYFCCQALFANVGGGPARFFQIGKNLAMDAKEFQVGYCNRVSDDTL